MGTSLHVRNLDEGLIRRLKQRAAANGRSMEAEHREILAEVLKPEPHTDFESRLADFHRRTSDRRHTPSDVLQRMSRDDAK